MVSTFTPNKSLELPAYNDYVDSWNTPVNADFTAIDAALGGVTNLNATASSGDITLTSTQYRPLQIIVGGTLTANVRYLIPANVGGQWTVTNNTSGAFTLTIASAAGGANITLLSGTTMVSCDGTATGMRKSTTYMTVDTGGTGLSATPTNGQLLIGNGTGYTLSTLTAGSGISVTNAAGAITITALTLLSPGIVTPFAGSSAPTGWLLCNGSAVNRSVYADLFAIVGTTYGAGDGSTTFNLPNLVDRFGAGAGSAYALGATGGAASGTTSSAGSHNHTGLTGSTTLTTAQMPTHSHSATVSDPGHVHILTGTGLGGGSTGYSGTPGGAYPTNPAFTGISVSNSNAGGGNSHDHSISTDGTHTHTVATVPPYLALNYIIKT